ncbi:MAG TPA: GMC family oxidoreductase [Geminicoccaceae bacterium]|nr:GMC family oxidoreductase [Geminicoccaceae bacterium]
MMLDARALPDGHRVHADGCVIGAGAAGITLAHELRDSGLKVALMEAGGRRFDAASQGLYEGEVADDTPHPPPHLYRQRRFGGSTTIWGGRCVPFDGIDFERRDHVPDSGWPIAAAELAPYYLRAQELCEAGPFAYTVAEALPGAPPQMIPGFASDAITTDRIERYSPPTDFGRRFGRELRAAAKVEVYLHAPCVELLPAHDGRSIGSARFVTGPAGRALTVHARRFVLATGGLEVPRLLLASSSVHAGGIGNHAGHVGRYYMTHIEGTLGVLDLGPANGHAVVDFERTAGDDRIYVRRRLGLSAEAQRRHGLLNFVARLFHESIVDPSHRNGVLSAMYLVKDLILPEYSRKLTTIELSRLAGTRRDARFLMRHLGNIVRDAPGIAAFGLCWAVRRNLARRRIPYVVLRSRTDRYPLDFNAEQSPNPESRVTLGNGRDALGMPRLRIDWRVNEDDYRSVERTYRLLQREFARTGAGRLEFDSDGLLDQIRRGHPVGGHHIGTTRMGDRPADGVVDRDCKVFHTENLFVAGSSVFRTSSHANPTLTIVALATRLADHLRQIGASA